MCVSFATSIRNRSSASVMQWVATAACSVIVDGGSIAGAAVDVCGVTPGSVFEAPIVGSVSVAMWNGVCDLNGVEVLPGAKCRG